MFDWEEVKADWEEGQARDRRDEADARHGYWHSSTEAQVEECWSIYNEYLRPIGQGGCYERSGEARC